MKKLSISIKQEINTNYEILMGVNLLEKVDTLFALQNYSKIAIITDPNLKPYVELLKKSIPKALIIELKPGEKHKNIVSIGQIWEKLSSAGFDRKSLVINLGGGVTTDMGGFAASTYMRGIDFINIPTTLLSMADASVGGKTGIDFAGLKNLIGTFNQPKMVIIDIATLKTLSRREYNSGFAEIIKHGLIQNLNLFRTVSSKKPKDFNDDELIDILAESCRVKKNIVENDQKEEGLRKILNFGHTVGHAIESLSLLGNKALLHGEAISIGMVAEGKISALLGYISTEELGLIESSLSNAGLPIKGNFDKQEVIKKISMDKKNSFGNVRWTILQKLGDAAIDHKADEEIIKKALGYVL